MTSHLVTAALPRFGGVHTGTQPDTAFAVHRFHGQKCWACRILSKSGLVQSGGLPCVGHGGRVVPYGPPNSDFPPAHLLYPLLRVDHPFL